MEPQKNNDKQVSPKQYISFDVDDFHQYFGGWPVLADSRQYEAELAARQAGFVVIFSSSPLAGVLPADVPRLEELWEGPLPTQKTQMQGNEVREEEPQQPPHYVAQPLDDILYADKTDEQEGTPNNDGVSPFVYTPSRSMETYLLARQQYDHGKIGEGNGGLETRIGAMPATAYQMPRQPYYRMGGRPSPGRYG